MGRMKKRYFAMPHDSWRRFECRLREGADVLCLSDRKAIRVLKPAIAQGAFGKDWNFSSAEIVNNRLRFRSSSTDAGGDCSFLYSAGYVACD